MKDKDFRGLISSVREAGDIRRGKKKPRRAFDFQPADVRDVRRKLRKSQTDFAMMIGVSVATLRNWEQGRRTPEGPARALLTVASKNPKAVAKALGA
jgi:putative transcriptional regulator